MSAKYTVLINKDEISLELLKYIDKNIRRINRNGIFVEPKLLNPDKAMVEKLRAKGITRLPAMITSRGNMIGLRNIIEHFEKLGTKPALGGGNGAIGPYTGDSTYDWLMQEMFDTDRSGKRVPKTDHDDGEDEDKKDIERRLKNYAQKAPKHQRAAMVGNGDDFDDEPMNNGRGRNGGPRVDPRGDAPHRSNISPGIPSDNIADMDGIIPEGTPGDVLDSRYSNMATDDAVGDKMWNALMSNMNESTTF